MGRLVSGGDSADSIMSLAAEPQSKRHRGPVPTSSSLFVQHRHLFTSASASPCLSCRVVFFSFSSLRNDHQAEAIDKSLQSLGRSSNIYFSFTLVLLQPDNMTHSFIFNVESSVCLSVRPSPLPIHTKFGLHNYFQVG